MKGLIIIIIAGFTFFSAIGKNEIRKEQIALEEQTKQEQQLEEQRLEAEEATKKNMLDKMTTIQELYLKLDGDMSATEIEHIASRYEGVKVFHSQFRGIYIYTEEAYLEAEKEAAKKEDGNWEPSEEDIIEYYVKERVQRYGGELKYKLDHIAFSDKTISNGQYMTGEILGTSQCVDSKEAQILYVIEIQRLDKVTE